MPVLKGKSAIVTGGALGIGKAIAKRFAVEGANVAIWDINADAAATSHADVKAEGVGALTVITDVKERPQVEEAMATTVDAFGNIDILVNNVGIFTGFYPFLEIPHETWVDTFRANVDSALICTQTVGRHMVDRSIEGRIINIGSVDAQIPYSDFAHYATRKPPCECCPRPRPGPGQIQDHRERDSTRLHLDRAVDSSSLRLPCFRAGLRRSLHSGRAGDAGEIAAAAVYLASPGLLRHRVGTDRRRGERGSRADLDPAPVSRRGRDDRRVTDAPIVERSSALLPDPEPRERSYTIISVDDHLVEPAGMFEGRLPSNLAPVDHASSKRKAAGSCGSLREPATPRLA